MKRPELRLLILAIALLSLPARADEPAPEPAKGSIRGKVKLPADSDASRVYVYLKGSALPRTVATAPTVIRQKNKQFGPRVLAVVRGTTVEFPNEDRIMHNVFSRSIGNMFDLGYYKRGKSKSVTFNKSGTVDIYCNIHPKMAATVLVVDNDFVTSIAADGSFELEGVPVGKYEVVAWMPASTTAVKTSVKAGATVEVALELSAPTGKHEHLNKDGQPYGRYK